MNTPAAASVPRAAAIVVLGLSMSYDAGASLALDGVSLSIGDNEFFTLLGPSGCGKTTLLRLIAGFEQPSAGSISLYGQPLAGLPPYHRPVNTVFQSYALFPHLTVAQNVAFGLEESRLPRRQIQERVGEMLSLVQLERFAGRKPAQLSGGQQQRVALARALANRPKVLLLDESLSALDQKLRKEMQLELKRLQHETGITFVFVTHDQEEALTLSDRLAVLRAGKVEQVGTPGELYDRPETRYVADFIGDMNFLDARVQGGVAYLGGLGTLSVDTPDQAACTLAVRPERVSLSAAGPGLATPGLDAEAGLPARVRQVVYVGSDTLYHLDLAGADGGKSVPFRVRSQNNLGASQGWRPGDEVQLHIPAGALRVLRS